MEKYCIDDLTAETLLEMARAVNRNDPDGGLERFDYWENDHEFFNTFYYGRALDAVRAAYYGDYYDHHDFVRIDSVDNLVSTSAYALEAELLEAAGEIAGRYMELVDAGRIEEIEGE